MGYSNFKKIKTVVRQFNLDLQSAFLFNNVQNIEPSSWLIETLNKTNVNLLTNEKAKSERIISPILTKVFEPYQNKVSFFFVTAKTLYRSSDYLSCRSKRRKYGLGNYT